MVGGCGHCPGHKHSLPEWSAIDRQADRQTDIDKKTDWWVGG